MLVKNTNSDGIFVTGTIIMYRQGAEVDRWELREANVEDHPRENSDSLVLEATGERTIGFSGVLLGIANNATVTPSAMLLSNQQGNTPGPDSFLRFQKVVLCHLRRYVRTVRLVRGSSASSVWRRS